MRAAVPDAQILVRVDPLYDGTHEEIDAVIGAGADIVMLPMFTSASEVVTFLELVNQRAQTSLLVETPQALVRIDDILEHSSRIDEIHVGLNDLHLGMKLDFMFELLSGGIIEYLAERVRAASVRFGFGGIARLGEGKVPAELILSEHVRLGSEMVILSRSFRGRAQNLKDLQSEIDLSTEISRIRKVVEIFQSAPPEERLANQRRLREAVRGAVGTSPISA